MADCQNFSSDCEERPEPYPRPTESECLEITRSLCVKFLKHSWWSTRFGATAPWLTWRQGSKSVSSLLFWQHSAGHTGQSQKSCIDWIIENAIKKVGRRDFKWASSISAVFPYQVLCTSRGATPYLTELLWLKLDNMWENNDSYYEHFLYTPCEPSIMPVAVEYRQEI